ncbi:MAG: hypothetical protein ACREI3_01340 [Nitrospirales bacterium]
MTGLLVRLNKPQSFTRNPWRDRAGICLTELLIALAAGAIVLAATLDTLRHFETRLWAQLGHVAHHQEFRLGVQILAGELRLAGTGSPPESSALILAEERSVEFLANLDGVVTALTEPVAEFARDLPVRDGSGWPQGKRILVCTRSHCAEGRLARGGRSHWLSLVHPLGAAFPAGSPVVVSNRVRYYLGNSQDGKPSVMRRVDGGTNALMEGIGQFRLTYYDREGRLTTEPSRVARVRIHAAGPNERTSLVQEVTLRAT